MVGLIFVTSGYSHLKDPEARAKTIEMSKGFTIFLGIAETAGGLGVAFGILTQLAAIGLILILFGAIQKKIFSWHTGFWGGKASGWPYDLILGSDEHGDSLYKWWLVRLDEIEHVPGLRISPARMSHSC